MIGPFTNTNRFLSNFWPVETIHGHTLTVEHLYQAEKTTDMVQRARIIMAAGPQEAKTLGRMVTMRPDWDSIKLNVMKELLIWKFSHTELREALLATGSEELVELNTWNDTFWGVCNGVGENHLGKLLMVVRDELANERRLP